MGQRGTRILIAGAGIGGLCAAIALRRHGFEVTVLEKQDTPREVGAALEHMGLMQLIDEIAVPDAGGGIFDDRGHPLATISSKAFEARFGRATAVVHRPEFLRGLWDRCDAKICGNAEVAGVRQTTGGVTVTLTDTREVDGDLLIGADGIHSTVRASLGHRSRPRYSGTVAYRGVATLAEAGLRADGDFWGIYLRRGIQAGCGPMSNGRAYWFTSVNAPPGGPQGPGDHVDDAINHLSPWPETMQRLAAATPRGTILRNDVYDLRPISRWSHGRVTLLGDAAHATTPHLGQGACMAIEDAAVIARSLSDSTDIGAALARYEAARLTRCNRVTRLSRVFGWCLQLENPLLIRARNATMFRGSDASPGKLVAHLFQGTDTRTHADPAGDQAQADADQEAATHQQLLTGRHRHLTHD
jgi:2-polyprenyl-6-methoxyphenol hydroxylase-like FAD-dependent oxidoreductase